MIGNYQPLPQLPPQAVAQLQPLGLQSHGPGQPPAPQQPQQHQWPWTVPAGHVQALAPSGGSSGVLFQNGVPLAPQGAGANSGSGMTAQQSWQSLQVGGSLQNGGDSFVPDGGSLQYGGHPNSFQTRGDFNFLQSGGPCFEVLWSGLIWRGLPRALGSPSRA